MLKIRMLYWRSCIAYKSFKFLSYISNKLGNEHTRLYNLTLEEIRKYEKRK